MLYLTNIKMYSIEIDKDAIFDLMRRPLKLREHFTRIIEADNVEQADEIGQTYMRNEYAHIVDQNDNIKFIFFAESEPMLTKQILKND